jgi:V/A-type H+-transporting ATPase subunit E
MVQMEAEQVVNKILADAQAEAEEIGRQAQEREAAENAKLDQELAQFEQETETRATKAGEDEQSQRLAVARIEIAKDHLATKASILDEVFAQARQQIEKLPDDSYRALMGRLMAEAVEAGDEQVLAGAKETRVDQQLLTDVNGKLKGQGKGNLTLASEKAGFDLGFLLQRGKVRTNVSLDVLISTARTDLEMDLAKDLFSDGGDGREAED